MLEALLVGILSGCATSVVVWWFRKTVVRRKLRDLEGFWIENVHSPEGIILITKFWFNNARGQHVYQGTNFLPEGPEWDFASKALVADMREEVLYYVYKAWKRERPAEEHYGFGYIKFEYSARTKRMEFTNGHYRGSIDGARPYGRTLYRAEHVCDELGLDKRKLQERVYQAIVASRFRENYSEISVNLKGKT